MIRRGGVVEGGAIESVGRARVPIPSATGAVESLTLLAVARQSSSGLDVLCRNLTLNRQPLCLPRDG